MCFKSVWHFTGNALDPPESMIEERLPFCGKCLLSSCLTCFKSAWHFAGYAFLSSFIMCFKSVWHFMGSAFDLPESMFEERRAFCGK